jgi:hypothetical protein
MLAAAIRITLSNALLPAMPLGFLASQARPRKAEALVTASFALGRRTSKRSRVNRNTKKLFQKRTKLCNQTVCVRKHFFFEKKKQKTFGCCRGPIPSVYPYK